MKRLSLKVLLAVAAIVPLACPTAGWARSGHDDRWQGDRGGNHGGSGIPPSIIVNMAAIAAAAGVWAGMTVSIAVATAVIIAGAMTARPGW